MFLRHFLSLIFPEKCAYCGKLTDQPNRPCEQCRKTLPRADEAKIFCRVCGREKPLCTCHEIYFDGCVGCFAYEGAVRRAMHNFKFYKTPALAGAFGAEMANSLRQSGMDTRFDMVCCVPLHRSGKRARGYNQSELLAREIAKSLRIPCRPGMLTKLRKTPPQHTLSAKQRATNLLGAFDCRADLAGCRILLVDDITTTGATLNECAKTLKARGAREVCGCVLATV